MVKSRFLLITLVLISTLSITGCGKRQEVIEAQEKENNKTPIDMGNTSAYDWGEPTKDVEDDPYADVLNATEEVQKEPEFTALSMLEETRLTDAIVQIDDTLYNMGAKMSVKEFMDKVPKTYSIAEKLDTAVEKDGQGSIIVKKDGKNYFKFGYVNASDKETTLSECAVTHINPNAGGTLCPYMWYGGGFNVDLSSQWIKEDEIEKFEKTLLTWEGKKATDRNAEGNNLYGYDAEEHEGYLINVVSDDDKVSLNYTIYMNNGYLQYIACTGCSLYISGDEKAEKVDNTSAKTNITNPSTTTSSQKNPSTANVSANKAAEEQARLMAEALAAEQKKQDAVGAKIVSVDQITDNVIDAYDNISYDFMVNHQDEYGTFTLRERICAFVCSDGDERGRTYFIYKLGTEDQVFYYRIGCEYTMIRGGGEVILPDEIQEETCEAIWYLYDGLDEDPNYGKVTYGED